MSAEQWHLPSMAWQPETRIQKDSQTQSSSKMTIEHSFTPLPSRAYGELSPPETPVDGFVQRDGNPFTGEAVKVAANPHLVQVGNASYHIDELRNMASAVSEARRAGELPPTSASPVDTIAIVQDYEQLLRLREARGDPSQLPTAQYNEVKVDIARRIQDRDSNQKEEARQQEVARRINSYMQTVGMEQDFFDQANGMMQRCNTASRAAQMSLDSVGEELCSVVEGAVETNIASAIAPWRMNLGRFQHSLDGFQQSLDVMESGNQESQQTSVALGNHLKVLGRYNYDNQQASVALGDHLEILGRHNQQLSVALSDQLGAMGRQNQQMDVTLTGQIEALNYQNHQMNVQSQQLSDIVMNLPATINQAVTNAVREQTQAALQDALRAQQQQAMPFAMDTATPRDVVTESRTSIASRGIGKVFRDVFRDKRKRSARRHGRMGVP